MPLPASSAATSSDWVNGVSAFGNVEWTFTIPVPAEAPAAYLPPGPGAVWWLRLDEGGFLNRSGRLTRYQLTWHAPGGDVEFEGGPTPQQTFEGQSHYASMPQGMVGVAGRGPRPGLRFGPNPVVSGGVVEFSMPGEGAGRADRVRVYDLIGREVGGAPLVGGASGLRARWEARSAGGAPLPAGLYFARAAGASARLVVVDP
jgi:hypothetical protein